MTRAAPMLTAATLLLAQGGCDSAPAASAPTGGAASTTSSSASTGVAAPTGTTTLEIVDQAGLGRPMTFGRISVPAGWRPQGGVAWDRSTACVTNQRQLRWSATAPDGITAASIFPGIGWQSPAAANQFNPCPVLAITSAREFLLMAARSLRPGSQPIGYRAISVPQPSDGNRADVGTLTIAYQLNGQRVEEALTSYVNLNASGGNTVLVFGYRAPAGRLDPGQAEAIRASLRLDEGYQRAYFQQQVAAANSYGQQQSQAISTWHNGRMADITARGMADRTAIRAQGNAEANAIYAQTAANTRATNDGIYASNLRALKEEQTWTNPQTGETVQGSFHGGQRMLGMPDGTYARTDDPYYNPAGSTEYSPD